MMLSFDPFIHLFFFITQKAQEAQKVDKVFLASLASLASLAFKSNLDSVAAKSMKLKIVCYH